MKNEILKEREWLVKRIREMMDKATVDELKNVYYMMINMIRR